MHGWYYVVCSLSACGNDNYSSEVGTVQLNCLKNIWESPILEAHTNSDVDSLEFSPSAGFVSSPATSAPTGPPGGLSTEALFRLPTGAENAATRSGTAPGSESCRRPVVHSLWWIRIAGLGVRLLDRDFVVTNFEATVSHPDCAKGYIVWLPKCAG